MNDCNKKTYTDTHTHIHRKYKAMTIGEIADFPKMNLARSKKCAAIELCLCADIVKLASSSVNF